METTEASQASETVSNSSTLSDLLKTTTALNSLQKGNIRVVNGEMVEQKSDIATHANKALLLLIKATLPLDPNTQKYSDTHQELDSFLRDLEADPNCVNPKTLLEFYANHLNFADNHIPFDIPPSTESIDGQELNNQEIIYLAALNLQRYYNQTESTTGKGGSQKIIVEEYEDGNNTQVIIYLNLFGPNQHYRMKMNMATKEVSETESLIFSRVE